MVPKLFPHRRIASCSRHTAPRITTPGCRLSCAGGNWGCVIEDRVEYGSVGCWVSPVASSCCAGFEFCGTRRYRRSSLGEASPWRRAARSCASRRPSCQALSPSTSLPAYRTRVATAGLCRGASWLHTEHRPRRHRYLRRVRLAERGPRNAPFPSYSARIAVGARRGAAAVARSR